MLKKLHLLIFLLLITSLTMNAQVFGVYAPCPGSANNPSDLYFLEDNGNATIIGPVTESGTPLTVNGLGYHSNSGNLYAMTNNPNSPYGPVKLYAINPANGNAILRGTISNPPAVGVTLPLIEYTTPLSFIADVDQDGLYRIPGITFETNVVTGVISNVKLYLGSFNPALTVSPLWQQISMDAATQILVNNFIAQTQAYVLCGGGPTCPKPEGGIQDWVYSNGKMISYCGVEKKLFSLDINTLTATTITPSIVLPSIPGSNEMGGIFKDNEDNFYAVQVYTGNIYLFDHLNGDILNPNHPFNLEIGCSVGDNASNPVGAIPLPAKLISFNANKYFSGAQLTWITAEERDLASFDIEKSTNGKNWRAIGNVPSKSSSIQSVNNNYTFNDNSLSGSVNFYRLKMIDNNKSYTYSEIINIRNNDSDQLQVFPNPAKDYIMVSGSDVQNVTIIDGYGRIVLKSAVSNGRIDVNQLQSGVYHIFINGDHTQKLKFVKL